MPNLARNVMLWFKLLRKDAEFTLSDDQLKSFEIIKQGLLQAITTILRLTEPGQQRVFFCDASFFISGFVFMIENHLEHKNGKEIQAYAPLLTGCQLFNTSHSKISTYYKVVLSLSFAVKYICHFIWYTKKECNCFD